MKKLTTHLTLFALIAFTANINAQHTITFSPGISLPTGDFSDMAGIGFGASAGYMRNLNNKMSVGGEIGYYSFSPKTQTLSGSKVKWTSFLIPIMVNYRYVFIQNDYLPYAEAQLNYTVVLMDSKITGAFGSITAPSNQLGLSVALGASKKMNDNMSLGFSAGYDLTSDIPAIHIDLDFGFDIQYLRRLVL